MANRFRDALIIQDGACNPSGIARSLHEACKECINEGVSQREDAAVRLITHQLAYLCGIITGAEELAKEPGYSALSESCRAKIAA
jgi:hypothetical protein